MIPGLYTEKEVYEAEKRCKHTIHKYTNGDKQYNIYRHFDDKQGTFFIDGDMEITENISK